ncbi:MAG: HemK2/MTQ2 family protein methyltransferase, partial [Thermoplasmatota archaeon]
NLIIKIHPDVYEPAEDTFLMLESISVKPGEYVLEIGTGCGIIALECASNGANVVCTDINPYAVELAKYNYHKNKYFIKGKFEVRKGNLFSPIFKNERFDVIIFNPPYLPTKKNELVGGSGWFDVAVDGGTEGLNLIKRFIKDLRKYLTDVGKAYFVFSSLGNRKKLHNYLTKSRLNYQIVSSYNFDEESISVYCVY